MSVRPVVFRLLKRIRAPLSNRPTKKIDPERYEIEFLNLGIQYYIAARCAAHARLMPACGNLFHHSIEMLLKAYLLRNRPPAFPERRAARQSAFASSFGCKFAILGKTAALGRHGFAALASGCRC